MQKVKKFYKVNEKIWIKGLKKVGVITKLDIPNKEVTVNHFADKDNTTEEIILKFYEIDKYNKRDVILFAKTRENAIIPSKNEEDGCYDLYACFDENQIIIEPNKIALIPTGICSSFLPKYRAELRERGSTGVIGMARRAGQIDSGYRGEWFFPVNNTSDTTIIISKKVDKVMKCADTNEIFYPYTKAIGQFAIEEVPNVAVKEISLEKLQAIPSIRGEGMLGSSGK